MTTEYISNELCENSISSLPAVSLQSTLNERMTNLPNMQGVSGNLKHSHNGPVILPSLSIPHVNLSSGMSIQTMQKRSPGDFMTLPIGSDEKYADNYMCRLCSAVIDIDSAISIFPNDFEGQLASKINKYLPIIVYESDPFPKTVCKSCVNNLNQFHDLVEKCVLVEEQLRQTYAFDGRYIDELTKKINQKSYLDMLKPLSANTEQIYLASDFQYINNLGVSNLNTNHCKETNQEKKEEMNQNKNNLKQVNLEITKSQKIHSSNDDDDSSEDSEIPLCKFCDGCLKDSNDCLQHSLSHVGSVSHNHYPCCLCFVSFDSKIAWESHVKAHYDSTSRREQKLNQSQNSRDKTKTRQQRFLRHKLKIFNKLTRCKKCKQSLERVETAIEHCVKHRPAHLKSYPCVLCVRRIPQAKLKDHVSLHYPALTKPIITCDDCNNLYPDEKTLKYHRCTKLRKYKCSQCKQGFKSEDRLKFHEDFHKNKSTFCDICKKDFKFESRIYLHFAGVHNGIRDKPYCCDVCGKTFTWLTVLNSHKRTHTNERPYKCSKCDARFCNKYSLIGHMPSHDDHPQFYCEKCDYHTGRKQNLQKHINRFHKEIKSSQSCIRCTVCNEIFPNKHHVEVEEHLSKHSPPQEGGDSSLSFADVEESNSEMTQEIVVTKLYQCERCERCYMCSEHLAQHKTIHSPDDSGSFYYCRLCESGFSKHDLLVKHQKIHVNISSQYTGTLSVLTVISCDICGIECVDYRQLLNHKLRGNCMMKKISGTIRPKKVLIKKHLKPLKTHQLFVNSNGLFECPTCQRTYKNRRRYRLHLATHTNNSLQ